MTSPRAWFLVHPRGLLVRREGDHVELPTDADAAALGVQEADVHEPGPFEGGSAVAAAIPDREVAPAFEIGRLFELYPAIGPARFMMAGCATQVLEWADTHRFCGRCATRTERVHHSPAAQHRPSTHRRVAGRRVARRRGPGGPLNRRSRT
jgi:NADH pyrophosphatase NudC (nudix superfamily)